MDVLQAVENRKPSRNTNTVRLYSWGANSYGQLSTGNTEDQHIPREVTLPSSCSQIHHVTGGGGHSLLVTGNGELFSCGSNCRGQLGLGHTDNVTELTRVPLPQGTRVTKAVGGWDFTLILSDTGMLYGCGSNSFGQLGLSDEKKCITSPQAISTISQPVIDVAVGLRHSLALTTSGEVYTWGSARKGQLGRMDSTGKLWGQTSIPAKVKLPACLGRPVQVYAGSMHSLAVTERDDIFLWGCNKHGQAMTDPSTARCLNTPRKVDAHLLGVAHIQSVQTGWTHSLCVTDSGAVLSWGRGDYGQLGRPCSDSYSQIPAGIPNLRGVTQLACGAEHNLAISDGRLVSWGWGEHGMCGNDGDNNITSPQLVGHLQAAEVNLIGCGAGHSFAAVHR